MVTGLKIWHLREESEFFPKKNFWNVIEKIAPKSDIILLFGEIDCREGILASLQKARYDSLEEAFNVLMDIYIPVIKKVMNSHNFNIFFHPVVPVLDPTRKFVSHLNLVMKKRLSVLKQHNWLDFFDDLLVANDPSLFNAEKYGLDGTHLNPSYVSLIEREINKFK